MIFTRIGNGPCYHHWTEIFAGVVRLLVGKSYHTKQKDGYSLPTNDLTNKVKSFKKN